MTERRVSRRRFIGGPASVAALGLLVPRAVTAQTPAVTMDELVIDLAGEPDNLDPALARSYRDWSVVHAIYDSVLNLGNDGELLPLAAESVTATDDTTWEIRLRPGLLFHDGSPVSAAAVTRGVTHVQGSEGPAAGSFAVIERVDEIDDLAVRLVTSAPAPWLPSQLAVWLVPLPEGASAGTFEESPIGSGPYRFASRQPGDHILLERNPEYPATSPKGVPVAERVRYRFVPEAATRLADLTTGSSHVIDSLQSDQVDAVADAGATVVEAPVLGVSFLRIVNDVAPFDDPRVAQAVNHAIDVETIAATLVSSEAHRLASLLPDERSIGFDPELSPFTYDPDRARQLLTEAGYPDGFETTFQFTAGSREDIMQAIAGYLGEVGISVTLESTELATFNGSWKEPDSAPLRFVSWRPVFDPHTLLSLMFSSKGPLSRYADTEVDRLIADAGRAIDHEDRQSLYQDLGRRFQEVPPAAFLWNLTALYGVHDAALQWSPRCDEYVIPTHLEEPA